MIWKKIPGYPGYEVSMNGDVRSYRHRNGAQGFKKHPHPIVPITQKQGYFVVSLSNGRGTKMFRIHRLVLMSFLGPPNDKSLIAAHLNGNRADNRLENLIWCTQKENISHRKLHGTAAVGEKNPAAILSASDVITIREKLANGGKTKTQIAAEHRVSRVTVYDIGVGKTWAHI